MGSFAARVDRWVEDIQLPPPPAQGVLTRVVGFNPRGEWHKCFNWLSMRCDCP